MNRNEIIELVVVRAAPEEQHQLRKMLSEYSTEELKQIEQAIVSQAASNVAEEELIRIRVEREANRLWHQYEIQQAREPQRRAEQKAQLEQDRETFRKAARKYGLSDIESNFHVVHSLLGSAFDVYQIGQAVASNAASLVPASQAELEQWAREDQEVRQDFLINRASPLELRAAARQESEQLAQRRQHVTQQIQIREQKESAVGYTPLPETGPNGEKYDRAFLLSLPKELYQKFCSKYGFSQITTRLNGGV